MRSPDVDSLGPQDRALLTEIVYGAVRWKNRLDHYISAFSSKDIRDMDPEFLVLLRLGAYQILFLDRVPDRAAVNETVRIAGSIIGKSKAGFINAVLRKISDNSGMVVFPDAESDLSGYLEKTLSQPRWLAECWLEKIGKEKAFEYAEKINLPMPLTVRANSLKTDTASLLKALLDEGVEASEHGCCPSALTVSGAALKTELFRNGYFYVQGIASQLAGMMIKKDDNSRILDLCCAPGGKLTHAAALNENSAVYGIDINKRKLRTTAKNCRKLGINNVSLLCGSAYDPPFNGKFDTVLLDAPCTGLGTIRSNPEIKWRVTEQDIGNYHNVQLRMLTSASGYVRAGGELIYSVCSGEDEEGFAVVEKFLSENRSFSFIDAGVRLGASCSRMIKNGCFYPDPVRDDMDGFFAAVLKKG